MNPSPSSHPHSEPFVSPEVIQTVIETYNPAEAVNLIEALRCAEIERLETLTATPEAPDPPRTFWDVLRTALILSAAVAIFWIMRTH